VGEKNGKDGNPSPILGKTHRKIHTKIVLSKVLLLQYVTSSPHKQTGQQARQAQCWPPHLQSFDPSDSSIVSFQQKN
jgi:hypothetical protein